MSAPTSTPAPTSPAAQWKKLLPATVTASSEYDHGLERHPGADAFDGSYPTAWCKGKPGIGVGEWVEATFASPQKIRRISVANGLQASDALFDGNARLKVLKVIVDGQEDNAQTMSFGALDTQRELKTGDLTATNVRFVVEDAWKGAKWEDLCVSEFEIWASPASRARDGLQGVSGS